MQKVVRAGNTVVLDEKNPKIRNVRDGTVIKLDERNGVCTMDKWMSGQAAFDKPVRPAAMCRGVTAENRKVGRKETKRQNGMELKKNVMRCQMKKQCQIGE